jgi:mono/diheme cytochrome c family protein
MSNRGRVATLGLEGEHMGRSGKAVVIAAALMSGGLGLSSAANAADVTYETQIKPIFKESCVKCHSLDNPRKQAMGGLRLDDLELALKGGKHKDDIVPGDSTKSLLYKVLMGPTSVDGKKIDAMPKQKRGEEFKAIDKDKIDLVKAWIDGGAK